MLYCGAAMAFHAFEKSETAAWMLPIYSEAQSLPGRAPRHSGADRLRTRRLPDHGPGKRKAVDLQKYNIDAYNRYVILLSGRVKAAYAQGDDETLQMLLSHVDDVQKYVDSVVDNYR